MQLPRPVLSTLACVLLVACGPAEDTDTVVDPAHTIITAAAVYTLDPEQPVAEAVAVRDGRVLDTGDAATLRGSYQGPDTRMLDLDGAYVYPGFTDSHVHLTGIGERELEFDLTGTSSLDELKQRVAERVASSESREWIVGRGWIESRWDPPVFPTRDDLDEVAPDNPVVLGRVDGHALVANSAALAAAGIGPGTEAPFGGEILRDEDGRATGMLIDAAQSLVEQVMPEGEVGTEQALRVGMDRSARLGWTQVQIAGQGTEEIATLQRICRSESLPIRIYDSLRARGPEAMSYFAGEPVTRCGEHYVLRNIKISVDGALGSRGAALLAPYADADGTGLITWREDDLLAVYRDALRRGVQVETHAIGDRANRWVLDLYQQVLAEIPPEERAVTDPRWRIEHAQILHPDDIGRFAELGIIPSMQASHAITDLHFAPARLGMERLAGAYAWRALIDSGVIIPGGSDAPVESGDPRIEFYAAVARRDLDGYQGEGWHPEQAMTRMEALKSLTAWPAYAAFQEDRRGRIARGYLADFSVLGTDLMTAPLAEIPEAEIRMTVVGGEVVFDSESR